MDPIVTTKSQRLPNARITLPSTAYGASSILVLLAVFCFRPAPATAQTFTSLASFSGTNGARLRRALAEKGQALPLLGADDSAANREYIRQFVLARDAELGAKYGVKYAEQFHYIGPAKDEVGDYVRNHAVPAR